MKLTTRDAAGISIGIELVVSVVLGLGAGVWLDGRAHTTPGFTLAGIVLGTVAGMRSLLRMVRRAQAEERRAGPHVGPSTDAVHPAATPAPETGAPRS